MSNRGNPIVDLTAGGVAGCCEALTCHPLDTIKVRMQMQGRAIAAAHMQIKAHADQAERILKSKAQQTKTQITSDQIAEARATARESAAKQFSTARPGFASTGYRIFHKDGISGLYRGLGAVLTGITPKMAIRFWSFEELKRLLTPKGLNQPGTVGVFLAGLGAGVIEAVAVVNPMEVIKIRLQTQSHSLLDPGQPQVKYRNAFHACKHILQTEGIRGLYSGVTLTAARQATNQGTNFTVYSVLKRKLNAMQPHLNGDLPGWQTSCVGLISGALGPFSNAPLDVVKTRVQREGRNLGESGFKQGVRVAKDLIKHEGALSLWRGITPRVMRVAPGQAVTFTVYEKVKQLVESGGRQQPLA